MDTIAPTLMSTLSILHWDCMSEILELHAVFHGFVQGVGFRATVKHLAQQLDLAGTVQNKYDGSVEIYAYGQKEILEKLLEKIKQEFPDTYISAIDVHYSASACKHDTFKII